MTVGVGTDSAAEGAAISLPKGGGAIAGIGETFTADLCTGTGSFAVPITLPPGRNGLAPALALAYRTGNGNGAYGLGWALTLPGVSRKTSRGLPRYVEQDTYLLSGTEDLVPISGSDPGRVRYRPRTEGLFARIEHVRDSSGDYWEVRGRDGLRSRYGTPRPAEADPDWRDPAASHRPATTAAPFSWQITETVDLLGNRVRYTYQRDHDQPLIRRIEYADYGDPAAPSFLVGVEFEYEDRPDLFVDRRAGFEIRTTLRCRLIRVSTRAADGVVRTAREYRLGYETDSFNGVSLLTRVEVVGVDDQGGEQRTESSAPLSFQYTAFSPAGRRFTTLAGSAVPAVPWNDPGVALVDLRGSGLPDLVELGSAHRYWSNRGNGRFDPPRQLVDAPPHALATPGVQLLDADGDGRADLLVAGGGGWPAGYFPLTFEGRWSRRSFRPYPQAPAVALTGAGMRFVDLDGDGLIDLLRSDTRLESWFNDRDRRRAWHRTARSAHPAVDLSDPRVRLADMTGDGLPDIVLLRDGNIAYWPNLGHGRWGAPVQMRGAPRLPQRYDPRRLLLGDVDGDGAADIVYVDQGRVLLWGNRTGGAWTAEPVVIHGTPDVTDADDVQLVDLHGTGMVGLLWSSTRGRPRFLDFSGGLKPYLLAVVDNNMGARTTVRYRPSTSDFLRDHADPASRWQTTLPFPVHVVSSVEVEDQLSLGRLTTQYRYHHGYWDGVEREFRGFAMVEQLDTETIEGAPGQHDSPPILTKHWYHVGPVAAVEADDWVELDLRHEYWAGDASMLTRPPEMASLLTGLPREARRDALRTLRGQLLRSELYAVDGTDLAGRPYTVTESLPGVREESRPGPGDGARCRIFFPFPVGQRMTRYERGDEPMTHFSLTTGHDAHGFVTGQIAIAVPRGRNPRTPDPAATRPYLATYTTTAYAQRDEADLYLVDRVSRVTTSEVRNDGRSSVFELREAVATGTAELRVTSDRRTRYDGPAFVGLPLGKVGGFGLPVRTEMLAFTDEFVTALGRPCYLDPDVATPWPAEYPPEYQALTPTLAGYLHQDGGYYIVETRYRYDVHDPGHTPRGPAAGLPRPVRQREPPGIRRARSAAGKQLRRGRPVDLGGLRLPAAPAVRGDRCQWKPEHRDVLAGRLRDRTVRAGQGRDGRRRPAERPDGV